MEDYSSETASKFTGSTLDRHVGRCVGRRAHLMQGAYCTRVPGQLRFPTQATVSTYQKHMRVKIRKYTDIFSITITQYYQFLHLSSGLVYFQANAAEKLTFYVLWLIFTPPL